MKELEIYKKIYNDLMAIADAGEYEELRREIDYYFKDKI